MPLDWRDAAAYDYHPPLDRGEWAWQFLRRNPDYRADHAWFSATWAALEADYGAPPQRDFFRWKQDPRAWRAEAELAGCGAEACPGENDQVLIECWMGARWGLRGFPPDPAVVRHSADARPAWREPQVSVTALDGQVDAWLQQGPGRIVLGFDLALPLQEQLEQARRRLATARRDREREGRLPGRDLTAMAPLWTRWLRLLDGAEAGATAPDLALNLDCPDAEEQLARARRMAGSGYRWIIYVDQ